MRTNIVIDDALMAEAQRLSGLPTKQRRHRGGAAQTDPVENARKASAHCVAKSNGMAISMKCAATVTPMN